jgi:ATP-dependent Clp protease ATP-binding subunit ClpA
MSFAGRKARGKGRRSRMNDVTLTARRFTSSAQHITQQMWARASDRGMSVEIEINEQTVPMLALWSLLHWERKVGLVALERMGVALDALARDVDRVLIAACDEARHVIPKALPPGQKVILVDFQSPSQLLAAAEREAAKLGHEYVGSEHLLLATIAQACSRLRAVLEKHAVTHDRTREAILGLLRS